MSGFETIRKVCYNILWAYKTELAPVKRVPFETILYVCSMLVWIA